MKKIRKIAVFLLTLMITFSMSFVSTFAATKVVLPAITSIKEFTANKLNFDVSKAQIISSGLGVHTSMANITVSGMSLKAWQVDLPASYKTNGGAYGKAIELDFAEVAEINGRQVNARVSIEGIVIGPRQNSEGTNPSVISILTSYTNGTNDLTWCGDDYSTWKDVTYSINIYWADTGETVDMPFNHIVRDIDSNASAKSTIKKATASGMPYTQPPNCYWDGAYHYYTESWEALSGFADTVYCWPENVCRWLNSNNKVMSAGVSTTTGLDTYIKSGVLRNTLNGSFSGRVEVGRGCATSIIISIPYNSTPQSEELTPYNIEPVLSISKARVKAGEEYELTATQAIHKYPQTILTPYSSLVLSHVVPDDSEYLSAKVLSGDEDITSEGTLSYDSSTRGVTFEVNDDWKNNITENYNGQDLKLVMRLKAKDISGAARKSVNHQASLALGPELLYTTNTVGLEIYQDVSLKVCVAISKDSMAHVEAHGEPTFIIPISGEERGLLRNKAVTFSKDVLEALLGGAESISSDGWTFSLDGESIKATSEETTLPSDNYDASCIRPSRFKEVSKTSSWEENTLVISFTEAKSNWRNLSHTARSASTQPEG